MSMLKPKIALCLFSLSLSAVLLLAQFSGAEEKKLPANPFATVGFESVTQPRMPGVTTILDVPSFPKFSFAELPADNLTSAFNLDPEIERLRGIVPLGQLSSAACRPVRGAISSVQDIDVPSSEPVDILWFGDTRLDPTVEKLRGTVPR